MCIENTRSINKVNNKTILEPITYLASSMYDLPTRICFNDPMLLKIDNHISNSHSSMYKCEIQFHHTTHKHKHCAVKVITNYILKHSVTQAQIK